MILNKHITNLQHTYMLHKMEFYNDQNGIMRRYMREKENWDQHLNYSKNFILKSAENKKNATCVILGSGWLVDVPISELSEIFSEVILIDIIHPKQIIHKTKSLQNVKFIHDDITGGLINFFYQSTPKTKALPETINSFHYNIPVKADFVISLNILCQLHIILIDYLKKFNIYSKSEYLQIEKIIQESHIKILPEKKSCLITDIEEEILDEKDEIIGVNPLIHIDLTEGNFSQQWQWKFDSKMTYRENSKTYFNTKAIDF